MTHPTSRHAAHSRRLRGACRVLHRLRHRPGALASRCDEHPL